MYYIRKLTKPFNFNKIKCIKSVDDIDSDIIKQELSTKQNTLSFWKCEKLEHIKETIKAIILSTSEISKSKFIMLDSNIIKEYELEVDESNKGKTGYKGYDDLHIDICNLTYKKLGTILNAYKKVFEDDQNTCEYQKDDIKELILEVIQQGLLDIDNLNESLKKDIIKLTEKNNITIEK